MDSTGDDDTDSVPDELFQRSSSAVAGAEEDVQHAQNPQNGDSEISVRYRRHASDQIDEPSDAQLESEEEDFSMEDDDRENRFEGPASTWRFHTESERALAASLDQQRANELSIHLYNAHALKARLHDHDAASQVNHYHSKKQWIKADEEGTLPWRPDADWTAWPQRPEDVPRTGEAFGVAVPSREDERSTYRKSDSWKPSADLEEEIQAIMLRRAKEQLSERRMQPPERSILPHGIAESSPRKRQRSSSSASSDESSSQSEREPHPSHSERHGSSPHDEGHDFKMLIDDEAAANILQPNIRHIVCKIDDLLLGLHKSRKGHVRESATSRSRSRSQRRKPRTKAKAKAATDDEDEGELSDQPRSIGKRKNARPSILSTAGDAVGSSSPDTVEADAFTKDDVQKRKRKPKLNPRDWSEVLGMASLVGWDQAVLDRASERCSLLFGERMTFRKISTGLERQDESRDNGVHEVMEEKDGEEGYSCPVETCPRHSEPWPLKKTWRWREHLKRSHKYSKARVETVEAELKARKEGGVATRADDAVDGEG